MQKPLITLSNALHQENPVVSLGFVKDTTLINRVKALLGASWSQSRKFWDDNDLLENKSSSGNRIYTYGAENTFRNFKNPLDDLL